MALWQALPALCCWWRAGGSGAGEYVRLMKSWSWPGSSRPSTSFNGIGKKAVDARIKSGHDEKRPAARKTPELYKITLIKRAQGMPGARLHPQPCVQKKAHKRSHHRYVASSDIPCAMVLRLASCSPR